MLHQEHTLPCTERHIVYCFHCARCHGNCSSHLFKYIPIFPPFSWRRILDVWHRELRVIRTAYKRTTALVPFHSCGSNVIASDSARKMEPENSHFVCNIMQCCQAPKLKIHSSFCLEQLYCECGIFELPYQV
jgi:hypothetical protein